MALTGLDTSGFSSLDKERAKGLDGQAPAAAITLRSLPAGVHFPSGTNLVTWEGRGLPAWKTRFVPPRSRLLWDGDALSPHSTSLLQKASTVCLATPGFSLPLAAFTLPSPYLA
ncbi:hypothetical protein E2C01_066897 [Portunus trituberculatus]|uniref:Uncharacterized protein n=1 Tax=Portunus trituberculatus TaxID=210409 RepID=A0A5B7HS74_PORTR|nr:hypothetical protein [Portunus trituberculatus]